MNKISAVIVGYNEAKYVKRCLDNCARWADEIIYFDSFSTDGSDEICRTHPSGKVRLFQVRFDNVRDQRNRALVEAQNEWRFVLDVDEFLSENLIQALNEGIVDTVPDEVKVVMIHRRDHVDGIYQGGGPIEVLTRKGIIHGGHPIHSDRCTGYSGPFVNWGSGLYIEHQKDMIQWMERSRIYWWCCPYTYTQWNEKCGRPPGSEDLDPPPEHYDPNRNVNVYEEFMNKGLDKRLTRDYLEKLMVITPTGWARK